MYFFFFILFLFLFTPVLKQEYKRDNGYNKSAKFVNLITSILLLFFVSGGTKRELNWAFDDIPNLMEKLFINIGILSPVLNALSWVLYIFLSFILSILLIGVALRKDTSKRLFLQVLPLYCLFYSINGYRYLISKYNEAGNTLYILLILFLAYSLIVILITVIYTRSFMKRFFHFKESDDSHELPDISDKSSEGKDENKDVEHGL